jgi:hypothetical protein
VLYWGIVCALSGLVVLGSVLTGLVPGPGGILATALPLLPGSQLVAAVLSFLAVRFLPEGIITDRRAALVRLAHVTCWSFVGVLAGACVGLFLWGLPRVSGD